MNYFARSRICLAAPVLLLISCASLPVSTNGQARIDQDQTANRDQPCPPNDYSERCAAWAAAGSANVAAILSALVAALTAVGLGLSFYLTRRSLVHAEKTASDQLRAYVYPHGMSVLKLPDDSAHRLSFNIKNYGVTPAHNLRVAFEWGVMKAGGAIPTPNSCPWSAGNTLAPDEWFVFVQDISNAQIAQAKQPGNGLYLTVRYFYTDHAGRVAPAIRLSCFADGREIPGERIFTLAKEEELPTTT